MTSCRRTGRTSFSSTIAPTSTSSTARSSRSSARTSSSAQFGRGGAAGGAEERVRRHPPRCQHAGNGRAGDGGNDSQPEALGARADHLHHRGLRRRSAHGQGLLARSRRLHGFADRSGHPADQGQGLRRPVSPRAAGEAAGERARPACSGARRARRRGTGEPAVDVPRAGERRTLRLAQSSTRQPASSLGSPSVPGRCSRGYRARRRRCSTPGPKSCGSARLRRRSPIRRL